MPHTAHTKLMPAVIIAMRAVLNSTPTPRSPAGFAAPAPPAAAPPAPARPCARMASTAAGGSLERLASAALSRSASASACLPCPMSQRGDSCRCIAEAASSATACTATPSVSARQPRTCT